MNTPRERYRFAIAALGWLIVLTLMIDWGYGAFSRRRHGLLSEWFGRIGQNMSDSEGRAWNRVHGRSRRAELMRWADLLGSADRLRTPARMLYGAYDGGFPDSFAGFDDLEERLRYRFPLVSFYTAWGDRPDEQFPARVAATIAEMGSVPFITWEPWVKDFEDRLRPELPRGAEREYGSLGAVARGDYDFYVEPWARAAAQYGRPILLRFAHEMNDPYRYPWGPQNGNRPEDFIAAWRHVHAVFQRAGARNVLWVWSPHVSMPWFEFYYPGDPYVDWLGAASLNYAESASWSHWWSTEQILGKAYPALEKLRKPIVLAEFGTLEAGGDEAQWYQDSLRYLSTHCPRVRAVVLFNQPHDSTLSATPLNWSPLDNSRACAILSRALNAPGR